MFNKTVFYNGRQKPIKACLYTCFIDLIIYRLNLSYVEITKKIFRQKCVVI